MKQVITRELAKKLIKGYEKAIEECRGKSAEEMLSYLNSKGMSSGLCSYCNITYDIQLYDETVLYNYLKSSRNGYISHTPGYWYYNGKSERLMITALQIRVDWLKANMNKFPSEKKWCKFWKKWCRFFN